MKQFIIILFIACLSGLNAQILTVPITDEMRDFAEFKPRGSKASKRHPRVVRSSFSSSDWSPGALLLSDGTVLKGTIKHSIARDVVEIEAEDTVRILAAHQIRQFAISLSKVVMRDSLSLSKKTVVFLSLPFREKNGYTRPKLFEVVVQGQTSLLRRYVYGTRASDRKLFLMNPKGKITQIKKRRGSVIKGFDGKHEELKSIVKEERLNMFKTSNVITLVEAYNKLMGEVDR